MQKTTTGRPLTPAERKRVGAAEATLARIQLDLLRQHSADELSRLKQQETRAGYIRRARQDDMERVQDHARLLQLQAEEEKLLKQLAVCRDAQKGLRR